MNSNVDRGILALARQGRLSAVSCLVQGPTVPENASALSELPVDIGLHLNFTEAFAGAPSPLPLFRLIPAGYLHLLPSSRVVSQIHRQLDAFEAHFQRPPDYIDGHLHVHQLPVIREKLVEIIAQRYATQRPWLRSTTFARPSNPDRPYSKKALIIAFLGARKMRFLAEANGLRMNHRFLGVYNFSSTLQEYRALLSAWLKDAKDGDLLMCHPAMSADTGNGTGPQRAREFAVLSSPDFKIWLDQAQLNIARLSLIPV